MEKLEVEHVEGIDPQICHSKRLSLQFAIHHTYISILVFR